MEHDTIPAPPPRFDPDESFPFDFVTLGDALLQEQVASGGQDTEEARDVCHGFVFGEYMRVAWVVQQVHEDLLRVYYGLSRNVVHWDVVSSMADGFG